VGTLAQGICRVEAHPLKYRLIPPVREFLMRIGPKMGFVNRVILANLWLFKPLFLYIFGKTHTGGAMLRTTSAVTMAQGSPAPNVMPQKASAVVNFRILPGETGDDLLEHLHRTLKGLPITVKPLTLDEPSQISTSSSEGFRLIEKLIKDIFGTVITTPYLVLASTDARKYESVSACVYRFSPYQIDNEELGKMHGTNENITTENVDRSIAFFSGMFKAC
jgi:carboxypeptidase PM20D1